MSRIGKMRGSKPEHLREIRVIHLEDPILDLEGNNKAAGSSQRKISYALNLGTVHNEATITRLAAQGHTNEAIATLLDTTEGTIKNRRQRIRRWLTALAEQSGVAELIEEWDKSGGDHRRAAQIQRTYPGSRRRHEETLLDDCVQN